MRILDLSQPHNTNTQEGALRFALQIFSGSEAAWEQLRCVGPSDAELAKALDSYFPTLLGFRGERQRGFTIGRMPEPYFVWGDEPSSRNFLAGPALLKKVRAVLCLSDRTQQKE